MKPINVTRAREISKLREACFDTPHFWLMLDGADLVITQQDVGSPRVTTICIPRRVFRSFVS